MKQLSFATLAIAALLAGPAVAADMAVKAPMAAPAVVADWTGFYLGGSLGGRWSDTNWTTTCQQGGPPAVCNPFADRFVTNNPQGFNSTGFRGGVYAGYNWQLGRTWVVGLEGDIAWGDNKKTNAGIPGLESPTVIGAPGLDSSTVKATWDGGIRGRVGFLVTPTVLLFGTGGVSWTHLEASATCGTPFAVGWCTAANVVRTDTTSTDRAGWTVGGGIEAMVAANWLLRGEYRYSDYGTFSFTQLRGPGVSLIDAYSASVHYRTHTALVGLAYKFGGPVVARY